MRSKLPIVVLSSVLSVASAQTTRELQLQRQQQQQLEMQQQQLAIQQAELAEQMRRAQKQAKEQADDLARDLRKLQNANRPKPPRPAWMSPEPPDERWVDDKYLKAYENSWFYLRQNYPLLGADTFVRGFFEAMLDEERTRPNWAYSTTSYTWLRIWTEAFVKKWGVPHARDVKPDSALYRTYAQHGTPAMRAYVAQIRSSPAAPAAQKR